jgi:hypothetical protein
MFNGMIHSREVRAQRRSSSESSGGSSSRQRRTTRDMEIERLREEVRQRDEYQKQQQDYWASYNAQQQSVIQVSMKFNN